MLLHERIETDELASETGRIVFSLEDGRVWASWPGSDSNVVLGAKEEVTEMMRDFLAQVELGERLIRKNRHGPAVRMGRREARRPSALGDA